MPNADADAVQRPEVEVVRGLESCALRVRDVHADRNVAFNQSHKTIFFCAKTCLLVVAKVMRLCKLELKRTVSGTIMQGTTRRTNRMTQHRVRADPRRHSLEEGRKVFLVLTGPGS